MRQCAMVCVCVCVCACVCVCPHGLISTEEKTEMGKRKSAYHGAGSQVSRYKETTCVTPTSDHTRTWPVPLATMACGAMEQDSRPKHHYVGLFRNACSIGYTSSYSLISSTPESWIWNEKTSS